jgi:hypothetical protein
MPRSPLVRRIAVGLAVGFVLLVVAVFYSRHATRQAGLERLEATTARLDATDARWRFDQVVGDCGSLPDNQNGALLVPRFKGALVGREFAVVRPGPTKVGVFDGVPPNRLLDDEGAAALDRALDGNDAALAVARSFKDYPRGVRRYTYSPDFISVLLPDLQETQQIVAMLDAEGERLIRVGRPGAALELVRAMLNAGRSIDGETFLMSSLIRSVCNTTTVRRIERSLALSFPKGEAAELRSALLSESNADHFWAGLRMDRAGVDMLMTNLRTGQVPVALVSAIAGKPGRATPSLRDHVEGWVREPRLPGDQATYLETVTQAYETRLLPEHQQRAALKAIPTPAANTETELTRLLFPGLSKLHDASLRAKAQLRCAAVGLAVERFRQVRGRWPASLEEIPKGILPAVPLDPFDGRPLKYVQREDGVTIYSVGTDEADNRGTINDKAKPTDPGQDVGFRLYNPGARGLPALSRPGPAPAFEEQPRRPQPGRPLTVDDLIDPEPTNRSLPYPRVVDGEDRPSKDE